MPESIIVTFHELNAQVHSLSQISPKPQNIQLNWLDLFENLIAWGYEDFQYPYSNNKFCGLLGKIQVNRSQHRVDLVFVVADADADHQCARHLVNRTTRLLTRNEGESADKRVHIVLKIDPAMPFIAKIAMEHERGVTTRTFVNTLNYLLKDARLNNTDPTATNFFIGEHPTDRYERGVNIGQPKPLGFKAKIVYTSVLSDEIIDAFRNGRVKNVRYLRPPTTNRQLDNHGVFLQDNLTVQLKVNAMVVPTTVNTRAQFFNWASAPFKEMISNNPDLRNTQFTIRFTDADGSQREATYDPQVDEFSLVKKGYITRSLRQAMTADVQLNTPLCDRMFSKI